MLNQSPNNDNTSVEPSKRAQLHIPLTEIPAMARDEKRAAVVFEKQASIQTWHKIFLGDARNLDRIQDKSVHLILTSPPYWTLKKYNNIHGQLGTISDYNEFLDQLSQVIKECYRVLIDGGRLICVVGDVCLSRRKVGKHVVYPLHSDITLMARQLGFDNLTPIMWYKIANARYEANTNSTILGKPYEPNAVIKNDIEFILIQRKPGTYRKPTIEQRRTSFIPRSLYEQWFRQIWHLTGTSTKKHPAPFSIDLALRLIRMYSFVGDTVLDPFLGTGTTSGAAMKCGRNSIGYEIDREFLIMAKDRLIDQSQGLFVKHHLDFFF
jgi:modification methylase